jgi:acyl-coenzyme A thioesterase PaaI-like protein
VNAKTPDPDVNTQQCAFQDGISDNLCFGCGPSNPYGLQIKSHWDGEEAVCSYQPLPHHAAGPAHIVNGGIIATLIDCHCVCTAIADAYRRAGQTVGREPHLWYATGALNIKYLAPAAIDQPLHLRAKITAAHEKKTILECSLTSDGTVCATAEVVAVRVPSAWAKPRSEPVLADTK